jgi:hypothetical protein
VLHSSLSITCIANCVPVMRKHFNPSATSRDKHSTSTGKLNVDAFRLNPEIPVFPRRDHSSKGSTASVNISIPVAKEANGSHPPNSKTKPSGRMERRGSKAMVQPADTVVETLNGPTLTGNNTSDSLSFSEGRQTTSSDSAPSHSRRKRLWQEDPPQKAHESSEALPILQTKSHPPIRDIRELRPHSAKRNRAEVLQIADTHRSRNVNEVNVVRLGLTLQGNSSTSPQVAEECNREIYVKSESDEFNSDSFDGPRGDEYLSTSSVTMQVSSADDCSIQGLLQRPDSHPFLRLEIFYLMRYRSLTPRS